MIRGETIQFDITLTLRPRPPTEQAWQAALRILAQRTDWTGNQRMQKLLIGCYDFQLHQHTQEGRNTVNLALTKCNAQGQKMNVALKSREKIPSQ